jgi:hypothetical protein
MLYLNEKLNSMLRYATQFIGEALTPQFHRSSATGKDAECHLSFGGQEIPPNENQNMAYTH